MKVFERQNSGKGPDTHILENTIEHYYIKLYIAVEFYDYLL